jgi:hypothetical protein
VTGGKKRLRLILLVLRHFGRRLHISNQADWSIIREPKRAKGFVPMSSILKAIGSRGVKVKLPGDRVMIYRTPMIDTERYFIVEAGSACTA